MPISIDHELATQILFIEAANAKISTLNEIEKAWMPLLERLSVLCPHRKSSTLLASFGTASLAKTVNTHINVFSLLERAGNPNDYSARSLADQVWAKHRAELGIDLGANGANPLNNTPFIGKPSVESIGNVRNVQGWEQYLLCMNALQAITRIDDAKSILRSFIRVRTHEHISNVGIPPELGNSITVSQLIEIIEFFVAIDSEGGRTAQAVASGIFSAIYGESTVSTAGINDPSRKAPLDISIENDSGEGWMLAVEVKDKPVSQAELYAAVERASGQFGVFSVVYIAIASKQKVLDWSKIEMWALKKGVRLEIITSWAHLVHSAYLHNSSSIYFGGELFRSVLRHMITIGVSKEGIARWTSLASPT